MATKHTLEEVKQFIKENCESEIELLSTEYVNVDTPLILKCKCGNVFEKSFYQLKKGVFRCKNCSAKKNADIYRSDVGKIKRIISEKGCEYISGEYKNNRSKLLLKCQCGNLFYKDIAHYVRQPRCQTCGKELSRKAKIKYTLNDVQNAISQRGYKIISTEYISCEKPLMCECGNGHKFSLKMQDILYGDWGCRQCYADKQRIGRAELPRYFRSRLDKWKLDIILKYNSKCYLTDSRRDCVIHHLVSLDTILKECCEIVGIDYRTKVKDIPVEKLYRLQELVDERHTLDNGVLLQRKVHDKFHALYGKGGNTLEQFNEFIQKHYPNKQPLKF